MEAEKMQVIKRLDEALDEEILHYAKAFSKEPSLNALNILCKLVTVDMYTDEYLEEHEVKSVMTTTVGK